MSGERPPNLTLGGRGGTNQAAANVDDYRKIVYGKIFDMIDRDGGGSLEPDELKDALAALGEFLTDEEVKDMINEIDGDGSGSIEKDEFYKLIQSRIRDNAFFTAALKSFELFADTHEEYLTQKDFMYIVDLANKQTEKFEVESVLKDLPWDDEGKLHIQNFLTEFFEAL